MNSFKNVFHRVRSSLRIQLILGVAGVHAVLMGVFTWDLTVKQRLAWREVQFAENSALTKSLAINSANWLSVRDLGGLQELVEALAAGHSEIRYVMVMDTSGQVLAHSQSQHRSKFIQGLPTRPDGLVNNRDEREGHTDLLFPVLLEEGQLTGWVKLGFAEERLRGMQRETAIWGLTYVFLSIVIGTLLAYLLARKLTARLYQLRAISAQVGAGHKLIQAPDLGSDEIGQLGRDFNAMLSALNNAQGRLEQTVTQRTASLETALRDLQSREASDARLKSLLFTLHQINQLCLQAGDTQALLAEACSTMVTRMGYERVTISRINPDGQELVRLASAGLAHGAALLPEEAAALVNLPPNLNGRLWCYRLNLAENGRGVLSIGLPENYTAHAEEPRILRMIAADLAVALRNLENLRALNQQREFAQLVLDHIEVGVVVSDPDGQLLLVNQAARIWLNVTDAELPLPEWPAHAQFQAVQGRAPLLAGESPLTLALKGQSTNQLDLILSRENAPQLRIRADAAPLRGTADGQINAVLVMHDISEQQRTELALRQAKKQAEQASQAKSQFLSAMSHELRTPLNAILGFAHILRDAEGLQAEHIQHLDIINRSGEHLLSVINAVLDLSRIESGVVSVELAPMDMAERVRDLVALMRPKAEAKKLNLRVSCDCPRLLRTDVTKLRQILFNLVGNSIKFTQKGSVSLRVVLLPAPEGMPPLLRIEVEDTGPGMTPEDQARIFEAFFQVAGLASTQGTGLGLPITRRYVELLGGKITCTSILGTGSIFRVELPVEFAVTQAAPPQVRKIKLAPGQPACRVLIVEDQPTNVLVLRHIMERVGFEVAVAENGALGVAAFRDWQPHWIWMDIMMPVMDGKEAARAIRALPGGREVKIVALTGCYLNEERADILAAGIDEVMGKPSSPPLLIECMQSHLDFKFINTETVAPPAAPEVLPPLPAGALSHLPEALRDELRTALFTLDAKKITAAAQALPPEAAAQAQLIIRHAQRLNYTALLQALDPVESGNAPA